MFEDDAIGIPRSLKHRHKKLSRPRCGASPPPADSCARLGLGRRTEDREVIGPQHVALRRDCTVAGTTTVYVSLPRRHTTGKPTIILWSDVEAR